MIMLTLEDTRTSGIFSEKYVEAVLPEIEERGGHAVRDEEGRVKVVGSTILLSSGAAVRVRETPLQVLAAMG
jgi:hypothetical protein